MEIIKHRNKKDSKQLMLEQLHYMFPHNETFYKVCKHCKSSFTYNKQDINISSKNLFLRYNVQCPVCKENLLVDFIKYKK